MLRTRQGWPCSRALLFLLLLLSLCVPDVRAIDLNIDDERECSVLSLQILGVRSSFRHANAWSFVVQNRSKMRPARLHMG